MATSLPPQEPPQPGSAAAPIVLTGPVTATGPVAPAPRPGQMGYTPPILPGQAGQAMLPGPAPAQSPASPAAAPAGLPLGMLPQLPGYRPPPPPPPPPPAPPRPWNVDTAARDLLRRDAQQQQKEQRQQQATERAKELTPGWQPPRDRDQEARKQALKEESDRKEREQLIIGTMYGASGAAQKAARGDASAFGDVAQSGAKLAGGMAGGPIGAAAMDALVGSVRGMIDGLDSLGKRLAEYSGALAQAEAQAEVAQILGDIRRASYAGNELAELRTEASRLSQAAQDALLTLVKPLIEPLSYMMKLITSYLEQMSFGGADIDKENDAIAKAQAAALNAFAGMAVPAGNPVPRQPRFLPPLGGR